LDEKEKASRRANLVHANGHRWFRGTIHLDCNCTSRGTGCGGLFLATEALSKAKDQHKDDEGDKEGEENPAGNKGAQVGVHAATIVRLVIHVARVGEIVFATIGPNTLSTDDEKVIECKADCVVVADELSAYSLRRHDRYLKVRDRALAHVLDDDSACLATLPELGCGVIETIDRSGICDCGVTGALEITRTHCATAGIFYDKRRAFRDVVFRCGCGKELENELGNVVAISDGEVGQVVGRISPDAIVGFG